MTKLSYNLVKDQIVNHGNLSHSGSLPVKGFDKHIRAIYFEQYNTIYFRFYNPLGEYYYLTTKEYTKSFKGCDKALKAFICNGIVPKRVKVLFWQTDDKVTDDLIRY